MEMQTQSLFERVLKQLKRSHFQYVQKTVVSDLLQIDYNELVDVTANVECLFFYFHQNMNYFLLIDKLGESTLAQEYVNVFFYYLKMLI
jgi:hypothetical protein